jgi:hypothetical protein
MKPSMKPRNLTDSLDKLPKQKKMDMRFGAWNVRNLEVNAEKTKYVLLSHHQNSEHNHDTRTAIANVT